MYSFSIRFSSFIVSSSLFLRSLQFRQHAKILQGRHIAFHQRDMLGIGHLVDIDMHAELAAPAALERGLAGLLDHQAPAVAGAYRREGLMLTGRIDRGEWPTLIMRKRRAARR